MSIFVINFAQTYHPGEVIGFSQSPTINFIAILIISICGPRIITRRIHARIRQPAPKFIIRMA